MIITNPGDRGVQGLFLASIHNRFNSSFLQFLNSISQFQFSFKFQSLHNRLNSPFSSPSLLHIAFPFILSTGLSVWGPWPLSHESLCQGPSWRPIPPGPPHLQYTSTTRAPPPFNPVTPPYHKNFIVSIWKPELIRWTFLTMLSNFQLSKIAFNDPGFRFTIHTTPSTRLNLATKTSTPGQGAKKY